MDIGGGGQPTSTLLYGHTIQALYEVYGQTIWWNAFKHYLIEYDHFYYYPWY